LSAPLRPARVRVPCSTSNLGAGFDCIGLALDRWLDVRFEPGPGAIRVERAGTLAALRVDAGDDGVVRALLAALAARNVSRSGGVLRMTSAIPVARGLGSSAAATVAGLALAAAAAGADFDRAGALAAAMEWEGHPDNAAPALLGGLVGIARDGGGAPRAFRLPLSDRIGFAWAAPPVEVSTARARHALPETVPHATAARALGRVAALVRGLAEADAGLVRIGFTDELHVPHRLVLIPGAEAAFEAARAAGAWAITVSGSGSGLIAACAKGEESRVAEAMGAALRAAGAGAGAGAFAGTGAGVVAFPLHPDMTGVQILEP